VSKHAQLLRTRRTGLPGAQELCNVAILDQHLAQHVGEAAGVAEEPAVVAGEIEGRSAHPLGQCRRRAVGEQPGELDGTSGASGFREMVLVVGRNGWHSRPVAVAPRAPVRGERR
jgi:hypothetical protein